jgi:hypothetical protein
LSRQQAAPENKKLLSASYLSAQGKQLMTSNIDRDIAAARTAWTDGEIESSRASMDAVNSRPREYSVGGLGQGAPPDVVPKLYLTLKKFWSKYGERFTQVWAGVDQEVRERVLRILSGGTMPRWPQDLDAGGPRQSVGISILCPILNIRELSHPETGVPKIIKSIVEQDIFPLYFEAGHYVRSMIKARVLADRGPGSPPHSFTVVRGEYLTEHKSYTLTGITGTEFSFDPAIQHAIDTGNAYEGPVFFHMITKLHHEFSLLLGVADEFHTSLFSGKSLILSPTSSCSSCGATPEPGVTKLKSCVQCHQVCYCSKACQQRHWSQHKAACRAARAKMVGSATGASSSSDNTSSH